MNLLKVVESDWPEEDLMAETARNLDKEERQEAVASSERIFWAAELLMEEFWRKIRIRMSLVKWTKEILISEFKNADI